MRILLDECVPWPLRHLLTGHECMTASYRGWGGFSNGELLRMAEMDRVVEDSPFFAVQEDRLKSMTTFDRSCWETIEIP